MDILTLYINTVFESTAHFVHVSYKKYFHTKKSTNIDTAVLCKLSDVEPD